VKQLLLCAQGQPESLDHITCMQAGVAVLQPALSWAYLGPRAGDSGTRTGGLQRRGQSQGSDTGPFDLLMPELPSGEMCCHAGGVGGFVLDALFLGFL